MDQTHKIFLFQSRESMSHLYNNSFLNKCLNEWSLLPYEIQLSPSVDTITKKAVIHLQMHYCLYIYSFYFVTLFKKVTVIGTANSH